MTTDSVTDFRLGSVMPPSRRGGERSEPDRNEGGITDNRKFPNPEVPAKAQRRRFSASYKLGIVEAAEQCTEIGEIGVLLRKEGLYSSQLSEWRKLRASGALSALKGTTRGPKKKPVNPLQAELDKVRKEKARLEKKLEQAGLIIEFQKKAAEILEIPLGEFYRSE